MLRIAFGVALLSSLAHSLQAPFELVSVGLGGQAADASAEGAAPSADGRIVAFMSSATNLAANDTNGQQDIFVRDRQLGATVRVSVHSNGAQSNGYSILMPTGVTDNGRWVLFGSDATNLIDVDTNLSRDLFVHDLSLATTQRVSLGFNGAELNDSSSIGALSGDGRFLVFTSWADNAVFGDTNGAPDVFVRDLINGAVSRVSVAAGGAQANGASVGASISEDGNTIAFVSAATNLSGPITGFFQAYVRDRTSGVTSLVSRSIAGAGGANDTIWSARVSRDGRQVLLDSAASDLVAGDTNGVNDAFVRDLVSGVTKRVSVAAGGVQANGLSRPATMSADGSRIVFVSAATNLAPDDTNDRVDLFLYDAPSGELRMLSRQPSGLPTQADSFGGVITPDGGKVGFFSADAGLVSGDTNGLADTFLWTDGGCWTSVYCSEGASSNGCQPQVVAVGAPSLAAPAAFTVVSFGADAQRSGAFFYGVNGPIHAPFAPGSSSSLCVRAPLQRTPVQNSSGFPGGCGGGIALQPVAFVAATPGVLGAPLAPGDSLWIQAWFRDSGSPGGRVLSRAVRVVACP